MRDRFGKRSHIEVWVVVHFLYLGVKGGAA